MNTYVITVNSPVEKGAKVKTKTILCYDDAEMFSTIQNAMDEKLEYCVFKADLKQVLTSQKSN